VRDPGVAGVAQAGVGLAHEPQAIVEGRVALGDRAAAVRGAVVDEDRLEVDLLRAQRVEALLQVRLHVVDGDDDADARHVRGILDAGPAPACWKFVAAGTRFLAACG
jgi:hypothetical protein